MSEEVDQILDSLKITKEDMGELRFMLVGASNAGKSELFNSLFHCDYKKQDVSAQTDKTLQCASVSVCGCSMSDSPGYGNMKSVKDVVELCSKQFLVLHVLNCQSHVSRDDIEMVKMLRERNIHHLIVANKVDCWRDWKDDERDRKAFFHWGRSALKVLEMTGRALRTTHMPSPHSTADWDDYDSMNDIIYVSARKGWGLEKLSLAMFSLFPSAIQSFYDGAKTSVEVSKVIERTRLDFVKSSKTAKLRSVYATSIILAHATICMGLSAFSLPLVDVFPVSIVQVSMVLALSKLYGTKMGLKGIEKMVKRVGGGFAKDLVVQNVVKLVPVLGSYVAGGIAHAGTIRVGCEAVEGFGGDKILGLDKEKDLERARAAVKQIPFHRWVKVQKELMEFKEQPEKCVEFREIVMQAMKEGVKDRKMGKKKKKNKEKKKAKGDSEKKKISEQTVKQRPKIKLKSTVLFIRDINE